MNKLMIASLLTTVLSASLGQVANADTLYNRTHKLTSTTDALFTTYANKFTTAGTLNDAEDVANAVKWANSSTLYFRPGSAGHGDGSVNAGFFMTKLLVKPESGGIVTDGGYGYFNVGSGGMEFVNAGKWGFCCNSSNPTLNRIRLSANQTWTSSAADGRAYFMTVGVNSSCWGASVIAETGCKNWTISGDFETWLTTPNNDFRDTVVTVEKPAELRLVWLKDARLNAKKLVLDGADMDFNLEFPTRGLPDTTRCYSIPAIDAAHLAPEVELKNGGTLTTGAALAADVVFAVPTLSASGTGNKVIGTKTLSVTQQVTAVSVPTASDALSIAVPLAATVADSRFEVSGKGAFGLTAGTEFDVVCSDGATVVLSGSGSHGRDILGAGALTVDASGEVLFVGSLEGFSGDTFTVMAGTLVLPDAAAIPSGVTVVTEGSAALKLLDATGFDKDARMGGTKNLIVGTSALDVTDAVREDETVTVRNGETLRVFGSGLKSTSSVVLEAGATVKFFRTATVFAPIQASAGSITFTVDNARVTGTIAGKFVSASTATTAIKVQSPGAVHFIGGADISDVGLATTGTPRTTFYMMGGECLISNETFVARCPMAVYAGRIVICGGGAWQAGEDRSGDMQKGCDILLNCQQTGDACLEIGKGGYLQVGNNSYIKIGSNDYRTYEARLFVNGGTLRRDETGTGYFTLRGNSALEVDNGGWIQTRAPILCIDSPRIVLRDGKIDGNRNGKTSGETALFSCSGTPSILLDGDFVFDLGWHNTGAVAASTAGKATWTATPDACLGLCAPERDFTFTLNDFVSDGLRVAITNETGKTFNLVLNNPTDPLSLTLVESAASGASVTAVGSSPALTVNYDVPAGATFDVSNPGYELNGFASTVLSDLMFREGGVLKFPAFGTMTPFEVGGTITLPETANYVVEKKGASATLKSVPVLSAAHGIVGTCAWTCTGGVKDEHAELGTSGDSLCFSYDCPGLMLLFR